MLLLEEEVVVATLERQQEQVVLVVEVQDKWEILVQLEMLELQILEVVEEEREILLQEVLVVLE